MNDMTYTGYILDQHRAADLAHENELMRIHRERGQSPARPDGQPLAAWFRGVLHHGSNSGASVAPSH
ncbi:MULTISPECIES: hypothetical protein [Microbacterium]|uniref:Uncharacterized protein n=1 Tax=Microbacterium trichothecenolyticum TaxID=69370 RepID=A0A0M2H3N1_MICTR|nr:MULTISPECIES: hypothetical protein [Microbacterium]KJL41042.1 hypothetical protein RS82_02957 [Microbacterium trichothecenolyticum]MDR7188912.1 hypothetical protein [Microbacterium sp. BE35]